MNQKSEIFYHGMAIGSFYFAYYFYITIPLDYDHSYQLRAFCERFGFSEPLTTIFAEERFARVTHTLIPGAHYIVKVFLTKQKQSFDECLEFAKSQKNVALVGIQGLLFLITEHLSQLPIGSAAISLDEKNALGVFSNVPVLPCACRNMDGKLSVVLSEANVINQGCCLLCFAGETVPTHHY